MLSDLERAELRAACVDETTGLDAPDESVTSIKCGTLRALLDERDELAAEVERLRATENARRRGARAREGGALMVEARMADGWTGSWCALCGFGVKVDEDGCCVGCGCQAVGDGCESALMFMRAAVPISVHGPTGPMTLTPGPTPVLDMDDLAGHTELIREDARDNPGLERRGRRR